MFYIAPTTVTTDNLIASTLVEDATLAWIPGTYAVGDFRHLTSTHRVYKCTTAGASAVSPDLDPARWKDMRPTNKWAPFDWYTNTAANSTSGDISYTVRARYCNAIMLRGMYGQSVTVSVTDAASGNVVWQRTDSLKLPATGFWDFYFGDRNYNRAITFTDLPIYASTNITITVSASGSETRSVGLITLGKLTPVHGVIGGTQWGAEVSPKTYNYRKTNEDGSVTIVPRFNSKDLTVKVFMDTKDADAAVQKLDGLLGIPVAWLATKFTGFSGLSVFGIATRAPVAYECGFSTCSLSIEGIV